MKIITKLRSALAAAVALGAFGIPADSLAQSDADFGGIVVGLDGGYSLPRGHEYGGRLKEGINTLHGFVGFRLGRTFEIAGSFVDVQSEIKSSNARALSRIYSIDGRFFVPVSGTVQPNLLLGYAPVADLHYDTAFGKATEHGYSVNVGAGVRVALLRQVFLTADFRHMFIRHTRGEIKNGAVTTSGKFDNERKGDIGALLVGGGFQF
jgi:hypothetical protein